MKYETIKAFVEAAQSGEFKGQVLVDNDCVFAYEGEEMVCDFEGRNPHEVLFKILCALSADVSWA